MVRIRFSVWVVSGYALLSVVIVTLRKKDSQLMAGCCNVSWIQSTLNFSKVADEANVCV